LAEGAKREKYLADGLDRDVAARDETTYRAQAAESSARAGELSAEIEALCTNDEPAEGTVTAALSTLEEVGAALQIRWSEDGPVPPEVLTAVRRLLGRTLVLSEGPAANQMTWQVTVRVPLQEGGVATHVRRGTVKASTQQVSANRNPGEVARLLLGEGRCFHAVGEAFLIDGSGRSNSHLVHQAKAWLGSDHVVDGQTLTVPTELRCAVLDAPAITRRVVYGVLTGSTKDLVREGVHPTFVDLVRSTYTTEGTTWGKSWAKQDFVLQRRLADLILVRPTPSDGVRVLDVERELGASYDDATALGGWRSGVPPVATRNWGKGSKVADDRRLFLVPCPWRDCPGHRRSRRTGSAPFASHYLWVPEVPGALLCPTCRRSPDTEGPFASARFPAEYFEPLRRNSVEEDGTRVGTRLETAAWVHTTCRPVTK
jgi:hypothetical protein